MHTALRHESQKSDGFEGNGLTAGIGTRDDHGIKVGAKTHGDGNDFLSLDQWVAGGLLFDHACYMAKLAQRTSTIAAVLWHQGGSDCREDRYPFYEEKLLRIIDAFRDRLGLHDVPFLVGGLGDFLKKLENPIFQNYVYVNEALRRVAEKRERVGFVSAEGLNSNPDNMHFSASALREFGVRYYEEFLKHEDKNKIFEEKPSADLAIVNELELL